MDLLTLPRSHRLQLGSHCLWITHRWEFMSTPDDLSDRVRKLFEEQENEQNGAQRVPESDASDPSAQPDVSNAQAQEPGSQPPHGTRPSLLRRRRLLIGCAIGLGIVFVGGGATWGAIALFGGQGQSVEQASPRPERTPAPTPEPEPEPEPEPVAEEPAPSPWNVDDPNSLQVVINKQRPFNPIDWQPSDLVMPNVPNSNGHPLRQGAAAAVEAMYQEAVAAGVPFVIGSGFRDYNLQVSLFSQYVASDGLAAADTYSARPGYSEHQTGLVIDISEFSSGQLSYEFGETPQGIWARDNAHRFGFIMRYKPDQDAVVGYRYEPWHFRYVGVDIATDMHNQGIANLEDYLGLPAAPDYAPGAAGYN